MDKELWTSGGEYLLEGVRSTASRARAIHRSQLRDRLNPWMQRFIAEQEMVFIASADATGSCDCSFRGGFKGFVRVLDAQTLAYPEYRGNGVYASLGNIAENPQLGMIFVDFFRHAIGLHVNGTAKLATDEDLLRGYHLPIDFFRHRGVITARKPDVWVVVGVAEAYVHCSTLIPLLGRLKKEITWATDGPAKNGGVVARSGDHATTGYNHST